jgi:hypothetical protein
MTLDSGVVISDTGYYNYGQFETLVAKFFGDARIHFMLSYLQNRGFLKIFCGSFDFVYNVCNIFLMITRKVGFNRPWFC